VGISGHSPCWWAPFYPRTRPGTPKDYIIYVRLLVVVFLVPHEQGKKCEDNSPLFQKTVIRRTIWCESLSALCFICNSQEQIKWQLKNSEHGWILLPGYLLEHVTWTALGSKYALVYITLKTCGIIKYNNFLFSLKA
jgi:hypothetical protein